MVWCGNGSTAIQTLDHPQVHERIGGATGIDELRRQRSNTSRPWPLGLSAQAEGAGQNRGGYRRPRRVCDAARHHFPRCDGPRDDAADLSRCFQSRAALHPSPACRHWIQAQRNAETQTIPVFVGLIMKRVSKLLTALTLSLTAPLSLRSQAQPTSL